MRARMTVRVTRVLRRGPSTFGQLKRSLGASARGPHSLVVLPNFLKVRGLSEELGDAVQHLIATGVVRVDEGDRLRIDDRPKQAAARKPAQDHDQNSLAHLRLTRPEGEGLLMGATVPVSLDDTGPEAAAGGPSSS